MSAPQGLVRFPGVATISEADFTVSHGISPGVATLSIHPQSSLTAETGALTFTFGGGVVCSWPDCKVDSASYQRDGGGRIIRLAILDRRWKWAFGEIGGIYNTKRADGSLDPEREKSPRKLAQLCFEAMGETRFNLDQLPDEARPEISWDGENPARALDVLVNELGCRVVPRLDGSVLIARAGAGAELPGAFVSEDSGTLNLPERPQSLRVLCGKNRYQGNFRLRAVGEETDGSIIPIDDLSYKPAGGWSGIDFPHFFNVAAAARPLAKKSVYRWYRIHYTKDQPGETLFVDGYGLLFSGYQLLPVEDVQVVTYEDVGLVVPRGALANEAREHSLPAVVTGIWRDYSGKPSNTEADTPVKDGWKLNKELGIVEFDRYTCRAIGDNLNNGIEPAELYLACAVSVRDPDTWEWVKHRKDRVIGATPTPPRVLKHDEITLNYVAGDPINQTAVDLECNHYLDAIEAEYAATGGQHRTYAGLLPIDLDGAIQQVAWHVGAPHASTQASRNGEFSLWIPPYKERRRIEQAREKQQ